MLEHGVLAHIGRDHPLHLAALQQLTQAHVGCPCSTKNTPGMLEKKIAKKSTNHIREKMVKYLPIMVEKNMAKVPPIMEEKKLLKICQSG